MIYVKVLTVPDKQELKFLTHVSTYLKMSNIQ